MEVKVNIIKSEEGLLAIRQSLIEGNFTIKGQGEHITLEQLIIREVSTGKTFINKGGFNGHAKDLWLIKKGTIGATTKTFIRASVGTYSSIQSDLKWWGIASSDFLNEKVEAERKEAALKDEASRQIISNFSDVEKANEWINNNEGNSQKRRTRWANRAERIGADRGLGGLLRDKCYELINGK